MEAAEIATIVTAIVTTIYTITTLRLVRLTRKQMRQEISQYAEQNRLSTRPYLNLYVGKNLELIDNEQKHYQVYASEGGKADNWREFSIRNIGNGTAKNVRILCKASSGKETDLSGRNGFLLVNKQYVYEYFYREMQPLTIHCEYSDLCDNQYEQDMYIIVNSEKHDYKSMTNDPKLAGDRKR